MIILISSVGSYLVKLLKESRKMKIRQQEIFDENSQTFPQDVIQKWEDMVVQWEADFSNPDPYEEPQASRSFTCRIFARLSLTAPFQKSP